MYIINRKVLGEFEVYTEEEAKEKGIEYKHWRDANEGEYCLSDDGYVAKVIRKAQVFVNNRKMNNIAYYYKLPYRAFFWNSKNTKLIAKDAIEKGTGYAHIKPLTFNQMIVNRGEYRRALDAYVVMLMSNSVDLKGLGERYFPKSKDKVLTIKRILKQPAAVRYVKDELIKRMQDIGIDKPYEYGLLLLKKAAVMSEIQRNPEAMIKVAKEINSLLDLYPKKQMVTEKLVATTSQEYLDDKIEKEIKKIEATRSEEI